MHAIRTFMKEAATYTKNKTNSNECLMMALCTIYTVEVKIKLT